MESHLDRRNLFAASVDQFFDPASEMEIAFVVDVALVPSMEPAAWKPGIASTISGSNELSAICAASLSTYDKAGGASTQSSAGGLMAHIAAFLLLVMKAGASCWQSGNGLRRSAAPSESSHEGVVNARELQRGAKDL